MPWKTLNDDGLRWHRHRPVRVFLVVLGAAVISYFAGPRLLRRYDRWDAKRSIEQARAFHAKGDYPHAMLSARRALDLNPMDPEAWRIVARTLEAIGSPVAQVWRSRLDSMLPGDPENILAWAKGAIEIGDWETATRVFGTLNPADATGARYHEIAAHLATRNRDDAGAATHWAEAVRLDPNEDRYKLNLAGIHLQSKDPAVRAGALRILAAQGEKGAHSIQARRMLLHDAVATADTSRARSLADSLVAAPGARFSDKLLRLSILRVLKDPESTSYLADLRKAAEPNPDELAQLLAWMNDNALSMLVTEWVPSLPEGVASTPPVCIAVAEAHIRSLEWEKLRAMTEEAEWAGMDFLRLAFLTRALERLGDAEAGAENWNEALDVALIGDGAVQRLDRLAQTALAWGWGARAEEALWKIAERDDCPASSLDKLWMIALKKRDTAKLHKVSWLIAKARPKDLAARNNFVSLSLLTRSKQGDPHQAAEELFRTNPGNPFVVSTYALSLYQRGRLPDAVAAMSALKPEELRDPQVAIYFGIFLTADGHGGRAKKYLEWGSEWSLLPEEEALLAKVKSEN